MMVLKYRQKEKGEQAFLICSAFIVCLLLSFFMLGLVSVSAQTPEYSDEQEQATDVGDDYIPLDARSYIDLSKAIYWERLAYIAESQADRAKYYQESKNHLLTAIQHDPSSSYLYTKLAEISILLRDFNLAKTSCESALKLSPLNANAHYLSGFIKYIGQDKKGAVKEFETAAELNPNHLKAQYYLASLMFDDGDFSRAAKAYSEMIRLRPYDAELRYRLGISYMQSGEIAKSIEEFRAATMLRKDYVEAHVNLAYLYARQSKNQEAIDECMLILSYNPDEPKINLLLAQLYVAVSEYDKAISVCRGLLGWQNADKPEILAEAYYRLAAAYKGKGDDAMADQNFQRSIDFYKILLEKEKDKANVNYDIAVVYDAKGDIKLAEKHFRRHIELNPNEPEAYNHLGYMFVENNINLDEAVELIKKAISLEPANGAFHDSLGWAYFKLNELDKAIEELEKAVSLMPGDSDIREHLGEAYLKRGGKFAQKAVTEWEKALEIKPGNVSLRQKLDELNKSLNQTVTE